MPSRLLTQIAVFEGQTWVALLVAYPTLRFLVRLPGRTMRYRRLLAGLDRPAPEGTPFVIRWDRYRFKTKAFLLYDTAKRGWRYTGQQITDDGWQLLFTKAPAGLRPAPDQRSVVTPRLTSATEALITGDTVVARAARDSSDHDTAGQERADSEAGGP